MTDGAGTRDQASLVRALLDARQAGDAELITSAAVSLPLGQRFGAHPGQVPALLYEAYAQATEAPRRCRLAAALARAWVYGGARIAVRKAISAALARVAQQDAALARLLTDTVRTGAVCRYAPVPARPVRRVLDAGSSRVTEG